MSLAIPIPAAVVLLCCTALGYAIATAGMKIASADPTAGALAMISAGLVIAVLAEVVLLRNGALPVIYLGIVVVETVLVLGYAAWIGERLSIQQMTGAAFVLGGFALVSVRF